MKLVLLIATFFGVAFSQTHDFDAEQKGFSNLTQAGKLFQLSVEDEGNLLKVFLTGQQAAGVSIDDATVEATFGFDQKRRFVAKKIRDSKTGKSYYKLLVDPPSKKDMKLHIKSGDNQESFTFPRLK